MFQLNRKVSGTTLDIRGLKKQFDNRLILNNIDLLVQRGEFLAVVGRSGSGKSTLLRLIAGLEEPSGGVIMQEGKAISGLNDAARIMFQEPRLLPWRTVFANIALGIRDQNGRTEKTARILEQVGLAGYGKQWPGVLSGGQRQRVALARALASNPRLLLLDEPLGALDALTRIEMQRLIEKLWQEQRFTALLVTHDVEEAVILADRVIMLRDGKVGMDIRIPLPRPRQRNNPLFASLVGTILDQVMASTDRQKSQTLNLVTSKTDKASS